MKMRLPKRTTFTPAPISRYLSLAMSAALLLSAGTRVLAGPGRDWHRRGDHARNSRYQRVNLVSDEPTAALLQDTNLVNAWGIAFSATSPFWISANGTGKAVLYSVTNDAAGSAHVAKLGLEVSIPGEGNLTGQVFNDTGAFHGDVFIFVSEDGTISGWRPALGGTAEILTVRTGAVYKAVTLATSQGGPVLLAANFSEATVDEYDANLNLIGQLSDSRAPLGFAPFNVQSVAGSVFVTYAKQDEDKEDDVAGPGNGLIDVLNPATGQFLRFATGSQAEGRMRQINSPWGVALAPKSFGEHGDELLVGNFGSGTIMAFDADGRFRGLVEGTRGRPIVVEGLWGLAFGNGGQAGDPETLYFTAGPDDESHGLFGSIAPLPRHGHDDDSDSGDDRD